MHLKFASRLQARKALARNGRLLTDTLMIGVVPCTDGVNHDKFQNVDKLRGSMLFCAITGNHGRK